MPMWNRLGSVGVLLLSEVLAGCAGTTSTADRSDANAPVAPVPVAAPGTSTPSPVPVSPVPLTPSGVAPAEAGRSRGPVVLQGSGQLVGPPSPLDPNNSMPSGASDGIQLSFVDVEIATVAATVLGDGLGLPYSIDPAIKGPMSLQSSRALSKDELLAALESALRVLDVVIVNAGGTYKVVPAREAGRFVGTIRGPDARGQPGFAIQIVPMKFIGVTEMEKILRPFAPNGGIVRVDEARNLLLIAGSSQELANMLEVVKIFDVDWLAGMSFALYTLNYVDAQTVITELKSVFDDAKSPLAGVIRFVPLQRLNTVLAMTANPKYLNDVETWIKRLDLGGSTAGRRIYVYDVQNGKASTLSESLGKILSIREESQATGAGTGASAAASAVPNTNGASVVTESADANASLVTGTLRIVPNDDNNSLLILASPGEFGVIESALQRLDVPARQVLIEASLAEVTLTDDLRYGVQFSYKGGDGPVILSEAGNGGISQRFPGFSYLFNGRTDISAVLNAIESVTTVKVLSSPKLMVLNNHEAQLQIGDQVPITVGTAVSTQGGNAPIVNSVQFRDTGVILRVTPRVNRNGLVQLEIAQEVSDVVPTTTSGIDSPTIQQRKFSSTVAVRSGETVALGGLIRDRQSKSRSGVPYLSKIPGLGALFRSTSDAKGRTELIVLLTPRVLQDPSDNGETLDRLEQEFRRLRRVAPDFKTLPSRPQKATLMERLQDIFDRKASVKTAAESSPQSVATETQKLQRPQKPQKPKKLPRPKTSSAAPQASSPPTPAAPAPSP